MLRDKWKDKQNDVDVIDAEDINAIANAVIDIENKGGATDIKVDETLSFEGGVLSVNTTDNVEENNTLPITSAGVAVTVGNIEILLKTI